MGWGECGLSERRGVHERNAKKEKKRKKSSTESLSFQGNLKREPVSIRAPLPPTPAPHHHRDLNLITDSSSLQEQFIISILLLNTGKSTLGAQSGRQGAGSRARAGGGGGMEMVTSLNKQDISIERIYFSPAPTTGTERYFTLSVVQRRRNNNDDDDDDHIY